MPAKDPEGARVPVNHSSSKDDGRTIYERLHAVLTDVKAIGKDSENKEQRFKFRGIDAVVNELHPIFAQHGVFVVPDATEALTYQTMPMGNHGKMANVAHSRITFTFIGLKGDSITSIVPAEAIDFGDKATAKLMSVALRTCLLQMFMIPTGEPDVDSQTYERSGGAVVKVDATGEDIKRIRDMVKASNSEADLKAAGYEMDKFNVTKPDTDLIFEEYRARKAEIDRIMSGDAWKTTGDEAKAAPAPNDRTAVASQGENEFASIATFAGSPGQIETLRAAQKAFMDAPDMPAIMKILTAQVSNADIGFPSLEDDGEMTTLRITFNHLPLVIASKVGAPAGV